MERYCASPISGMGTTLALNGAYNLAGAILQHPDNLTAAFVDYEKKMRSVVDRAQGLPLGGRGPRLAHPETAWGIWIFHLIVATIYWSGLANLIFMLVGPPANAVPVDNYGFRDLPELGE